VWLEKLHRSCVRSYRLPAARHRQEMGGRRRPTDDW